jgi:hypothetical protein
MAYTAPGVEVTEEIINGGGTNSTVPVLPTVIVGPAYNVVLYTAGSPAANVTCFAGTFSASASGVGTTSTYDLPSPYAGQIPVSGSVEVFTSNALIETYVGTATVQAGTNVVVANAGQPAYTETVGGIPAIQLGYPVSITYSNGDIQNTFAYQPITATNLTLSDTLSGTGSVTVTVDASFSDVLIKSGSISLTDLGVYGTVIVDGDCQTTYGTLVSGDIYIQYDALRQDISNQMLTFNIVGDIQGTLGVINATNRLALGVEIAMAGAGGTTPIYGMAVAADDLTGYLAAVEAMENQFMYCICPLTQQIDVLTTLQANVDDMSLPTNSDFRVLCCNTAQVTSMDIGIYSAGNENTGATIAVNTGGAGYIFTATNATFISDGVLPSDVVVTAAGNYTVQTVVSNQQLIITGPTAAATGISYYVTRNLTPAQMAQNIADISSTFADSRVWHVQPDIVGVPVGTTTQYLPGYYLAAAIAGMSAGEPCQQSFTNLTVPGISDLVHSNFFYTKTQLNLMAGAGTCLVVQKNQGGLPYCRHSLTTNMANVTSQEIMLQRDTDAVAYYFKALLAPYVGKWNVVADTILMMTQTINAGIGTLLKAKLPQIGAPIRTGSKLVSLGQNPNAADSTVCVISAALPYPNNYIDILLQV